MSVAPITFAPPPARAMLQPSIHARGSRPYRYIGTCDEWHAPGMVWSRSGNTHCAADAAWLIEPVLGRPTRAPNIWPGVPGAADRARAIGSTKGLHDYQQIGAGFLAERDYGALFDAMGIGKTAQSLIAAEARLSLAMIPAPTTPVVLIICPALAKRHWQREVVKWTGHEASVLESLAPEPLASTRYVICNYDIVYGQRRRDALGVMHEDPGLPGWGGTLSAAGLLIAILDESHSLRGRDSRRTKSIRSLLKSIPVVWMLTGTPMPNYTRDLWAQLDLLTGGLAGKYWAWCQKYADAKQSQYGWIDKGSSNLEELAQRLSFFALGRSKASVQLQLPEKRREIFRVDVESVAATKAQAEDALSRANVVSGALRSTARAKRPAVVAQAVEAMQGGQKVIVFTYHREQADAVAKNVRAAVDRGTVLCVHGDLSPDGRDKQAQVFREVSAPACFVATIDSVGLAISLVGADLVIFGDLLYEPHKLLQAEARAHRHGSTCRVLVRYVVATGTIDEALAESVLAKLATIEEALGGEPDAQDLSRMLGGNVKTTEEIVSSLFDKLKAWGTEND